jgi:DNA-binding NtrC family response regulator
LADEARQDRFRKLVGQSPGMLALRKRLGQVAGTPLPVLIQGETGTGKEVVARTLHELSGRHGPFIPVDCAALSSSLVESELFGHERGAFTGANTRREGLVHAAQGGTFFLDEIGELSLEMQTRLLRLLEAGTYRPVGSETERKAEIRVVAATWRNLADLVGAGNFRRDLYHRLSVVELHIPPLRARKDDVEVLLDHYLELGSVEVGRAPPELEPAARKQLVEWPWPGNVRELRNVTSYLCAMTLGPKVRFEDLPPQMLKATRRGAMDEKAPHLPLFLDLPYMEARRKWLDDFQFRYVEAQMSRHDGNVSATARAADMDRKSIQRILARGRAPAD